MRLSPGVMPVIKSHVRLRLSSKMLSLYSSLSVIVGSSVMGARSGSCSFCGSCAGPCVANCGAIGTCCASARPCTKHTASATQKTRRRAITRKRISHVAEPREGLFGRAGVESFDGLVIVRQRRRLLNHVDGAELLHVL